MNNIYKVIWSKAKNCYVVASEIAKSHTKSASGQSVRRSALASLLALSLLCGGLGVASASLEVVDQSGTAGTVTIYTKDEVDLALTAKGAATDVAKNTADIAANKANITKLENDKLSKDVASATYATKDALNDLTTTVNGKADESTVATALDGKANKADTLAGYGITDAYTKGDVDDKLNAKADAANVFTKDQTYTRDQVNTKLADYAKSADVYTKTDADAKFATSGALTTAKTELEGKINAEKTARENADKALSGRIGKVAADGNYIKDSNTNSVSKNLKALDDQAKKNADAIDATNKRTDGITRNGAASETTIEGHVTVNSIGDVTARGQLTAQGGVNAGNSDITTTGDVSAGSLNVTDASHLKGDVTMDKKLSVTGDTSLKGTKVDGKLAVTDDADLKNTKVDGTLITTGEATFQEAVEMDKGLTVTRGDTSLKGTKVDGKLAVTDDADLKNTKVDGTLITTGKATFQEAVEMDKGLTVTGDTKLKATTVDGKLTAGDADLKNTKVDGTLGVTGDTTLDGALTAKGEAKFEKNVTVEKDLTVNGKLNVGEIYLENNKLDAATGEKHDSATAITADGISNLAKVTDKNGNTSESKFTHNEEGMFNYAKDEKITGDKNTHTYSQTAAETKEQLVNGDKSNFEKKTAEGNTISIKDKDAAGNPKSLTNKQTVDGEKTSVTNNESSSTINQGADQIRHNVTSADGKKSSIEVKADGITNTSKDGTITNDAKDIVNNATGNMTNTVGGDLTTTVGGNELHEVTGTKTENVTGKVTENYKAGQETNVTGNQDIHVTGKQTNKIDGDQENTIGGDQITTVEGNAKEDYKKDLTTTVGGNELHEVTGTKIENVTGKVTENYGNGQATNVTGDQDITVSGTQTTTATDINRNASSSMVDKVDNAYGTNTETKEAGKTTTDVSIKGTGEKGQYIRGANESRDYLIKGTLMNSETKTAEATSTEITDGINKASTRQDAKNLAGSVTNGTETGISGIHANDDGSVSIDSGVTDGSMSSVINQKKDSIQSAVGDGTNSTVIHQDKDNVTIASSNGTVAIVGKDIVNNASESITNKAKTMDTTVTGKATESYGELDTTVTGQATENFNGGLNTKVTGAENHTVTGKQTNTVEGGQENIISGGQTNTITGGQINNITGDQTTTVTGMVTENYKAGQATNVTGNQDIHVTGKQTNKIDGNQENTIGGDQTTNVTGDISNTAKNITNAATETLTDKVGDNTRVINSRSITDTVGRANRMIEDGKITDNAGDFTVTTDKENGTTFMNAGSTASSFTTVDGRDTGLAQKWTNVKGNEISTGKVEANYVKMDYADVMNDLGVKGTTTTKTLKVTENATVGGTLDVTQKATFHDDVDIKKNLSVDGNATIKGDVTARSYKVDGKTYIDANGINANNQKITNVADGSISEGSKDAVNGGQLYGVKRDLEHQVDKVGANAAAMANLRPMEFDPSSKWNIAAAIGNYGSETAAAIGAFYRPNDNVMVNLSTAFGTGENMVGGGVSVRLGKGGNKLSREETNALKAQVADLTARMDALLSVLNPNMSKDFPDVPENHWAYEAVSRLAGNDIVQGYPDGEFHGERTMTRYEMAEIIYNALSRGAEAEKELVEEFKPELQAMAASEKATAERAEG